MNWSRVRWLLIVCLLIIDGILGVLLLRQYRGENTVSRAALEDTAQLLAAEGILLDPDIVPTAMVKDYVYSIPVSDDAYRTAFTQMVGSAATGVYLLPSSTGMSMVFENGDRAEYYHNLYLTYTRGGEGAWAETVNLFLSSESEEAFPAAGGRSAITAAETAKAFLSGMTVGERDGIYLRPRTEGIYQTPMETVYLVVFREEIARGTGKRTAADICGTQVCVLVEGDTVLYLAGTWLPFLPDEVFDTKKLDQVNILFSELRRKTGEAGETLTDNPDSGGTDTETDHACTVSDMERVYYMLWDGTGKLYLRPAWSITYLTVQDGTATKRETVCDGVNGSVVRQNETAYPA